MAENLSASLQTAEHYPFEQVSETTIAKAIGVGKALRNPLRAQIFFNNLGAAPVTARGLVEILGTHETGVGVQLKKLEDSRLAKSDKKGPWVEYVMLTGPILQLIQELGLNHTEDEEYAQRLEPQEIDYVVRVMDVLADSTRATIFFNSLGRSSVVASTFVEKLNISVSGIRAQLRYLKDSGLATAKVVGKSTEYRMILQPFVDILILLQRSIGGLSIETAQEPNKWDTAAAFMIPFALRNQRQVIEVLFRHGSLSVETIAKKTGMSQKRLSGELPKLEKNGFLSSERKKRQVFYTLIIQRIFEARADLIEIFFGGNLATLYQYSREQDVTEDEEMKYLQALSHQARLHILLLLRDRGYRTQELQEEIGVTQQSILGHITRLSNANLVITHDVRGKRKGRSHQYTLNLKSLASFVRNFFKKFIEGSVPQCSDVTIDVSIERKPLTSQHAEEIVSQFMGAAVMMSPELSMLLFDIEMIPNGDCILELVESPTSDIRQFPLPQRCTIEKLTDRTIIYTATGDIFCTIFHNSLK